MYAISTDNDRRPSQTGPARPELPILFHLIDVSRPRPAAPDVLTARAQLPPPIPIEPPIAAVDASTVPVVPPTVEPATFMAPPVEIQSPSAAALPAAALEAVDAEVVESLPKSNVATTTSITSSVAETELTAKSAITEAAVTAGNQPSQPAPTVTLKSKTDQRRQKRTSASEDWFASHGKFIAIAFVIALIGTVYLARTNRQQATPAKEEASVQSPLVELRPTAPVQEIAPARVQTVAAVSDSKVELQPPSAPPLIASAPHEKPSGADKLFDFPAPPPSAKEEQHVAARPTTAAVTTSSQDSRSPAQQAPTTAPSLTPAYPVANSPAAYPTTIALPTAYPQTPAPAMQAPTNAAPNYRTPFPAPPTQQFAPQQPLPQQTSQQQPLPQQPPAGGWSPPTTMNGAGQYQPIDNTARGPRYERTGSGRY